MSNGENYLLTPAKRSNDNLLTALKVAISLGLIAYLLTRPILRDADWSAILASLRAWPWLVGLVLYFVAIGLQVFKWQYLLRTLDVHVSYPALYRHNLIGLFVANLPLSMIGGDIARGWNLARHATGQVPAIAVSVLVDRLIGFAAYLAGAVLGMAYAVWILGRADLTWLFTVLSLGLLAFILGLAALMSGRLRRLLERLFHRGLFHRFLPLYQKLSGAVQGYRTHGHALLIALALGLGTVAATCGVNYLAAIAVGADIPLSWVFVLTPLTALAPFLPSIASGLGWNQGVFLVLYVELAKLGADQPAAFAGSVLMMSFAMQAIILLSSLPGAFLWWQRQGTESLPDQPA